MTVIVGTLALTVTGLLVALLLARSSMKFRGDDQDVVETINRLLPQTQCAQCGYPGCRPYAEAIATGEAINRCPPGGEETIRALSNLLGRDVTPLAPDCGETKPPLVARIREAECIGCTFCIQACPVDAIFGSAQTMHTIIESECTGCELCLPPCPVDCIDLIEIGEAPASKAPVTESVECIRCGWCEPACPRDLSPQNLYWFRDSPDDLAVMDLNACIECRRCDRVCPSEIPLTEIFSQAKRGGALRREATARADEAKMRFERRGERLANAEQHVRVRPSRDEASSLLNTLKQDRP